MVIHLVYLLSSQMGKSFRDNYAFYRISLVEKSCLNFAFFAKFCVNLFRKTYIAKRYRECSEFRISCFAKISNFLAKQINSKFCEKKQNCLHLFSSVLPVRILLYPPPTYMNLTVPPPACTDLTVPTSYLYGSYCISLLPVRILLYPPPNCTDPTVSPSYLYRSYSIPLPNCKDPTVSPS